MLAATTPSVLTVPLEQIVLPDNVREHDRHSTRSPARFALHVCSCR